MSKFTSSTLLVILGLSVVACGISRRDTLAITQLAEQGGWTVLDVTTAEGATSGYDVFLVRSMVLPSDRPKLGENVRMGFLNVQVCRYLSGRTPKEVGCTDVLRKGVLVED